MHASCLLSGSGSYCLLATCGSQGYLERAELLKMCRDSRFGWRAFTSFYAAFLGYVVWAREVCWNAEWIRRSGLRKKSFVSFLLWVISIFLLDSSSAPGFTLYHRHVTAVIPSLLCLPCPFESSQASLVPPLWVCYAISIIFCCLICSFRLFVSYWVCCLTLDCREAYPIELSFQMEMTINLAFTSPF